MTRSPVGIHAAGRAVAGGIKVGAKVAGAVTVAVGAAAMLGSALGLREGAVHPAEAAMRTNAIGPRAPRRVRTSPPFFKRLLLSRAL